MLRSRLCVRHYGDGCSVDSEEWKGMIPLFVLVRQLFVLNQRIVVMAEIDCIRSKKRYDDREG